MSRRKKNVKALAPTSSRPSARLLLDSGAVVALERGDRPTRNRVLEAARLGIRVAVPTAVVAETWRGGARSARVAALLCDDCCDVEDLTQELARTAGTALG